MVEKPVIGRRYKVIAGECGNITCGNSTHVVGTIIEILELTLSDEIKTYKKVGYSSDGPYPDEANGKIGATCSGCIKREHIVELSPLKSNKITIMKKLSNFIKKTVNADTQELLKAGLVNGDLEPTDEGIKELTQINWFANLQALVDRAKELNAEAEAESKKNK